MRNIELKVKVEVFKVLKEKLFAIDANRDNVQHQVDTYFHTKKGRLKLREINEKEFKLIYYERPDNVESKVSTYEIVSLDKFEVEKVKSILSSVNGVLTVVDKERELWIYKNNRIHLDNVTGLGRYVELETVINDISMSEAQIEHKEIIDLLELGQYEKCAVSYSDLLLDNFKHRVK